MVVEIKLNYTKCTGCKKCIEICSFGVLEWFEDVPVIANPTLCSGCLKCQNECSTKTITVEEK